MLLIVLNLFINHEAIKESRAIFRFYSLVNIECKIQSLLFIKIKFVLNESRQ